MAVASNMNDRERQGIESILRRMPDRDLFPMAETISNRMVHVGTQDEAVTAILRFATNARDVLRRQKMRKEYVLQYLLECNRPMPAASDRITIICSALEFWQSNNSHGVIELMEEDIDTFNIQANHPSTGNHDASRGSSSSSSNNGGNFQNELQTMASEFVTWFYPLLNNGHVSNPNSADNFGPHHFWRDCQMKISSPQYERLAEGSETVSRALLELIGDSQLYFNPFDAQRGVRCECDPHGLVVVLVGGSVHRGDEDSVGIFEQKFGLIRDPSFGNTWKIKFVELQLCGKDLHVASSLDDHPLPVTEGTAIMVASPATS